MARGTHDLPQLQHAVGAAADERGWDLHEDANAWQTRQAKSYDLTRYTRFVGIMKIVLPAVATLLVALVVLYSVFGRDSDNVTVTMESLGSVEDDKQMIKPKLTGTDGRNQPFTITAKAVGQELGKNPKVTLFDVEGDITMENKSWMKVEAKSGLLDATKKLMTLTGAINIYSDLGYECHTDAAQYDMTKGLLSGTRPIDCQGPLGAISANGFEGMRKAEQMKFIGGVTTKYYPPPRKQKPQPDQPVAPAP